MSKKIKRLTVEEVAAQMKIAPKTLRIALQQGKFPFGSAIRTSERWVYYINEAQFKSWKEGKLNV